MMDIIVSNDCISLLSNFPFTVIIELITFLFYHRKNFKHQFKRNSNRVFRLCKLTMYTEIKCAFLF